MAELLFLNYLFQTNSFRLVILNGITEDYFTTYKEHFKFLKKYYDKYNQLPSKETFQSEFDEDFEWLNVTDPEDYLVNKLKEGKLFRDVVSGYKEMQELIKNEKTQEAISLMSSMSQQFLKQEQSSCIDLIANASLRYEDYMEKVKNPDKYLTTTGLPELDEILGGWDMLNESAIIAARTGFGKSWWLIFFAIAAAKKGLKVGFYSGEMDPDLVGYRLDTFIGNIPNGSLTHGNSNIQLSYKAYIEELSKNIPGSIFCITPDMIDGFATVSKLRAFIEKYDIQFLCVDQFSLLEDERRGRSPREQAINISKDLRALQKLKKIPILAAVQLNREDTIEEGPTTKNISESDRIGQDATTVLFIERKNDTVTLTVGKARNAKTGDKLTYYWNINLGQLNFIPTENDALNGKSAPDVANSYTDSDRSDSVF